MQEGSVEEEKTLVGGGGEGVHLQVIQSLWDPPGDGEILPILGTGDLVGGPLLAGSGQDLVLGDVGVEEDEKNPQRGGGGAAGVRIFL